MRLAKSLLCGLSALAFSAGAAFAGQGSSLHGQASTEISPPELLSDENFGSSPSPSESVSVMELERADRDQYAGSMESDVIYLYPVEVTEYYLIIPESQDLG
jgi:hypothetical protein